MYWRAGKPRRWSLCCTTSPPLYHAPLDQSCERVARCEVGLKSQLQDADAIQIDLIIFDLARRAMRAEAPLLANNISEWPA